MKYKHKKTGEYDLFVEIWNERPHISFVSGLSLGLFNVCFFAHVLPKGTYPDFRLLKKNIVLLTKIEHGLWDQGTRAQRDEYKKAHPKCEWALIDELKDELRSSLR